MRSPSPAPSPAPSPPPSPVSHASLFQRPSSNGSQDNVAHQGSAAAWPSIESQEHADEPLNLPYVRHRYLPYRLELSPIGSLVARDEPAHMTLGDFPDHNAHFVASLHPARSSDGTLHHECLQSTTSKSPSSSATLDHEALIIQTSAWPPLNQPAGFSMIGAIDQEQLSLSDNPLEEKRLTQDFVGNDLSVPEALDTSHYGSSMWSPQQPAINAAASQNFMSYNNSYLMPHQPAFNPAAAQNFIGYNNNPYPPPNKLAFPPFPLQRTQCAFCPETFTRPSDLSRHHTSVHLGIKHHCFYPGCPNNKGHGYCRPEKLRTHQREKHGAA